MVICSGRSEYGRSWWDGRFSPGVIRGLVGRAGEWCESGRGAG